MPPKISIKPKEQKKEDTSHIISTVEKTRDPFTDEQLKTAIGEYAAIQEKNNQKSWSVTIENGEPEMKEDDVVFFYLHNKTQELYFDRNKEEFTQFLRDKLNNQYISLKCMLREKENITAKTIDPMEKFDQMVKENPLLVQLRDRFKLEL